MTWHVLVGTKSERTPAVEARRGAAMGLLLALRGISFFLTGRSSHATAAISFRRFSTISTLTTLCPASPKSL
jgi:hypothetical protein